jgi:hypothetical protein
MPLVHVPVLRDGAGGEARDDAVADADEAERAGALGGVGSSISSAAPANAAAPP